MPEQNNPFGPVGDGIRAGKLERSSGTSSWVEESFFDAKDSVGGSARDQYVGKTVSRFTIRFFSLFVLSILFLLLVRVFYLQGIRGSDFLADADQNRQRILPIVAERGLIYDRNGIRLTENIPNFSLALIPQDLPRSELGRHSMIKRLAEITSKTEEDIEGVLDEFGSYSYESIVIQENLAYEDALRIHIAASELPGIGILQGSKRLYALGSTSSTAAGDLSSLSHVLGYLGKLDRDELDELYGEGYYPSDVLGKTGVEKTYETFLRGQYGKKRIEVDASGREQTTLAEEEPVPGSHIELSIDVHMQDRLEQFARKHMEEQEKTRASAIALDPNTGEILALVSIPSFDNNDFSGGISHDAYSAYIEDEDRPLFNRAIGGRYPSGSVIKPLMAAIALQEGVVDAQTSIPSTGGIRVGPWFFPDWQAGGHGPTNVQLSIAQSVNTFYYYIGGGYGEFQGLGVERVARYLTSYGFAEVLGIDIPGESFGFVPTREWKEDEMEEEWYVGDSYNLSIGQGYFLTTPLRMAYTTALVANRGVGNRPHVVRHIVDPISEEKILVETPDVASKDIDTRHFDTVALGMRQCVLAGTCRRLASLPAQVAGKTGTAQWNANKENHAWFTSYAPFDNPEIVLSVLVEEGGEGSGISVPIAYDFYQWWWQYRNGVVDE